MSAERSSNLRSFPGQHTEAHVNAVGLTVKYGRDFDLQGGQAVPDRSGET